MNRSRLRALQLQGVALDRLMSPGTASRLLDLPLYAREAPRPISLNEVYATLQGAVWSELKRGGEIDRMRRNLQREHQRMQGLLVRVSTPLPADAQSLCAPTPRRCATTALPPALGCRCARTLQESRRCSKVAGRGHGAQLMQR